MNGIRKNVNQAEGLDSKKCSDWCVRGMSWGSFAFTQSVATLPPGITSSIDMSSSFSVEAPK